MNRSASSPDLTLPLHINISWIGQTISEQRLLTHRFIGKITKFSKKNGCHFVKNENLDMMNRSASSPDLTLPVHINISWIGQTITEQRLLTHRFIGKNTKFSKKNGCYFVKNENLDMINRSASPPDPTLPAYINITWIGQTISEKQLLTHRFIGKMTKFSKKNGRHFVKN
jgi:hypothetical protein